VITSAEKLAQRRASQRVEIPAQWDLLIEAVIGAASDVHAALGPALAPEVYEHALAHELGLRGLAAQRGRQFPLQYKGVRVADLRVALIVNELVVLDLHASDQLGDSAAGRLDGVLRAADLPLGLLINFNTVTLRSGVYRRFFPGSSAALALKEEPHRASPR
jgi:GxxExxY protein